MTTNHSQRFNHYKSDRYHRMNYIPLGSVQNCEDNIYSRSFEKRYPINPVESPDRVIHSARELEGCDFVELNAASLQDVSRVHGCEHIERVKAGGLYDAAALAAGGAIRAAELALDGETAFALIRPPGHYVSANRA